MWPLVVSKYSGGMRSSWACMVGKNKVECAPREPPLDPKRVVYCTVWIGHGDEMEVFSVKHKAAFPFNELRSERDTE